MWLCVFQLCGISAVIQLNFVYKTYELQSWEEKYAEVIPSNSEWVTCKNKRKITCSCDNSV